MTYINNRTLLNFITYVVNGLFVAIIIYAAYLNSQGDFENQYHSNSEIYLNFGFDTTLTMLLFIPWILLIVMNMAYMNAAYDRKKPKKLPLLLAGSAIVASSIFMIMCFAGVFR